MRRGIGTLLLATAVAFALGCGQGDMDHEMGGADSTAMAESSGEHAGMDVSEIRSGIEAANAAFAESFGAGDAAGGARAAYAEDAIIFPPGSPPVEGREAIVGFWEGANAQVTGLTLTTLDVRPAGEGMAWEVGEAGLTGADGPLGNSSYIVIWKRTPDGWKIYRDIWNSDGPAEPSTAPAEGAPEGSDATG